MPIIIDSPSYQPVSLSKTKEPKTWNTENYLRKLSEVNHDIAFNDQISKITKKQYDFDKVARDEKHYNLDIYNLFFHPFNEIVEENMDRILQFQYSQSPTFRRLVNYYTDNLPDTDTNKCQIHIANNYAYNKKEDDTSEMFIAVDEKGTLIAPQKESSEYEIPPEKILLNLFLKHISNPNTLSYDDTDMYTNIIFKELNPLAMTHSSKSLKHASVGRKHKLFNSETSNIQTDNLEQVMQKGTYLQKKLFNYFSEEKQINSSTIQPNENSIKRTILNGLLLSSNISNTVNSSYNQHAVNTNLSDKINIRQLRALPEEHAAPIPDEGSISLRIIADQVISKIHPVLHLLKEKEIHTTKGYHELLAFSKSGEWTGHGRNAAKEYIVEMIKGHLRAYEVRESSGGITLFLNFVLSRREHEYKIFSEFARDVIVHPAHYYLTFTTHEKGKLIYSISEDHYIDTVKNKFTHNSPLKFDEMYGKESIFLSIELHTSLSKKNAQALLKIIQLVIHNLSKNGGGGILCSPNGVKYHRYILNTIVKLCKPHQKHINQAIINNISEKIVEKNDFSPKLKKEFSNISNNRAINPKLIALAVEKQLIWAETHYLAQNHIQEHMEGCEILSLMDVNKMVKDTIISFVHQINEINEARWMSSEEQHEKKIQALNTFKTKISSMNGGQQFVYGFNKVIQEGLGGLIELSFDIDNTQNHRTESSLTPSSREGLHLLGTFWNIVMTSIPGFNSLAGASSMLNHAVVEKSTNVCEYIQDVIRVGMEEVSAAKAKFTQRASNAKYIGLRLVEEKINKNVVRAPQQRGSSFKVIESIENTDLIYESKNKKILELTPNVDNELYVATGFDNKNYGYYKRSGDGFYRKQHSFKPLSRETPNKITFNNREVELIKEPNSEIYSGTFIDNGKSTIVKFYGSSDGSFYQSEGLKGGGVIRHTDNPYSELKEGDIGYDEDLLDITDDSPELEETLLALSEDLYPSEEDNVKSLYDKFKNGDVEAGMKEVTLCRGTINAQAEGIVTHKTAGGVEFANSNVHPVSEDIAKLQVKLGRIEPEYTTSPSVADRFSRAHYLVVVKVKIKYLTRGSISENGWIIPKNAPIEPVGIIDRTYGQTEKTQQANASK